MKDQNINNHSYSGSSHPDTRIASIAGEAKHFTYLSSSY